MSKSKDICDVYGMYDIEDGNIIKSIIGISK